MPTYKGNVGHLIQHWTLCELLNIAHKKGVRGLNFIDAHAMAPIAYKRAGPDTSRRKKFDRVRARLPRDLSVYEKAWHHLAPRGGYPSSANFVQQVWTRDFSMLLCEIDLYTIGPLRCWLPRIQAQRNCRVPKVCRSDWRDRFASAQGLPLPDAVDLPDGSLTLVSFDPDLISCHPRPARLDHKQQRRIYPQDLQDVRNQLAHFDGGVLIHLPTYSAQNNKQPRVICSTDEVLTQGADRFTRKATVLLPYDHKPGFRKDMMSLVYARGLDDWAPQIKALPACFRAWYDAI